MIGEGVVAVQLERRRHPGQFGGIDVSGRHRRDDARGVAGEGAGLVERHHLDRGEGFERGAALDEDPHPRRRPDRGHDGDRHRDGERAWCGGNQHDQRPADPDVGVAEDRADHRDGSGDDEDRGDEGAGDPLRQSLGVGFAVLGLLDHVHNPGEGAVGGGDRRLDSQQPAAVDGGRENVIAGSDVDGDRLAGDGGQVDRRGAVTDDPVGRDPLPCRDHYHVTGDQLFGVDGGGACSAHDGDPGRDQGQQGSQAAAGSCQGVALEGFGDREQERERRRFAELAEDHGADRRDRHERPHAELAAGQRPEGVGDEGRPANSQRDEEQHRLRRCCVERTGDQPAGQQGPGCGGHPNLAYRPERCRAVVVEVSVGAPVVGAAGVSHGGAPGGAGARQARAWAGWRAPRHARCCPPGSGR